MKVGASIAEIGPGTVDGEAAILRYGDEPGMDGLLLYEVPLHWHAGAARWVGRPALTLQQRDQAPLDFALTSTLTDWGFIFSPLPALGEAGLASGTNIHALQHARDMWKAGLRLQEHLSGYVYAPDGSSVPRVGTWWYLWDVDAISTYTQFIAQYAHPFVGAGIGVELVGGTSRAWRSSGWQNSAAGVLGKRYAYPDFYGRIDTGSAGQGRIENLTLHTRWVADPAFTPPSQPPVTTNLRLWADASQEADGPLHVWSDRSGSGNNLVAIERGRRPTVVPNVVNGKKVVRFDGVDDFLRTYYDRVADAQPNTIILVLQQKGGGAAQHVWFDGTPDVYDLPTSRNLFYRFNGTNGISMFAGGEVVSPGSGSWASADTPFRIYTALFNQASSGLWENATSIWAGGSPGTSALSGVTLGATYQDVVPAHIDVAEVLVYHRALTSGERQQVVDWLNAKYALF